MSADAPDESPAGGAFRDCARETGPALEAWFRFLLWLVPAVERFPRRQKFLLGDRIQGAALDILDALVEATYTRERDPHLARANLGIEKLRFLFRLARELRFLDPRRGLDHFCKEVLQANMRVTTRPFVRAGRRRCRSR